MFVWVTYINQPRIAGTTNVVNILLYMFYQRSEDLVLRKLEYKQ